MCKYKSFCVQDVAACATSSQGAPWVVLLVLTAMENMEQEPGWMKTLCPIQALAPATFKSALLCQNPHRWQLLARFPPGEMQCYLWWFFLQMPVTKKAPSLELEVQSVLCEAIEMGTD